MSKKERIESSSDFRKTNYRCIVSEVKKEKPVDQISVRVGPETIRALDKIIKVKRVKKVDFVRDAINYWISIRGKAFDFSEKIKALENELKHSRRIYRETKKYLQGKIEDRDRIILEMKCRNSELEELVAIYKKE